jgi:arylsulfatase A-like enzyme
MSLELLKSILVSLTLAGLVTFSAGCAEKNIKTTQNPNKPNIVVIVPDDLGWCDVGYHGSSIKTPHIDELANTGIKLEQHYVMPTCTPTRVSLMTGRYPSRYGIIGPDYGEVIDIGDPTMASLLADNEYFTSIAGKWHMGSPPYTPLKYGFHSSYGYFDGQIDPYTHEYKAETELTSRKSWHRNDEYIDEGGHATDLITDEALRIINGKHDKPFFLYVAYSVPHFPLNEPKEWIATYDDNFMYPSRKWFAASVTHMDAGIGKIIEALKKSGQRENTLILFISDNGGQYSWYSDTEYRGKYADKPHLVLGNNFPLRGWKGDLYEGGIRVPAIVNWPGHLEPGITDSPIHISDWLPTICNLAGCKNLQHLILDGQNIWPLLNGNQQVRDESRMYWKTEQYYAVRKGNWKLVVNRINQTVELYNLDNDFRESQDLSKINIEMTRILKLLLEEFKKGDR